MAFENRMLGVVLAGLALVLISIDAAQARAWEWAKRLPVNQYSEQDLDVLTNRMYDVLDQQKDGEAGEWKNPETGHSGLITPLTTESINDRTCRETRFTGTTEGGKEHISDLVLCKMEDGSWKIQPPVAQ